jgi:hypothetical protein
LNLCSEENLLAGYYLAKCPICGFIGCSSEWIRGVSIADSGDYTDPQCPKCFSLDEPEILD